MTSFYSLSYSKILKNPICPLPFCFRTTVNTLCFFRSVEISVQICTTRVYEEMYIEERYKTEGNKYLCRFWSLWIPERTRVCRLLTLTNLIWGPDKVRSQRWRPCYWGRWTSKEDLCRTGWETFSDTRQTKFNNSFNVGSRRSSSP